MTEWGLYMFVHFDAATRILFSFPHNSAIQTSSTSGFLTSISRRDIEGAVPGSIGIGAAGELRNRFGGQTSGR